jgi:hypothetical protein
MKKPYQIESQRAVKRLEEMAAEGNPTVQMVLPPRAKRAEHTSKRPSFSRFATKE